MELQALLVLCGVGVAGIAVLLLMGLFSTSGTSYEEAIAQQRKATSELLALADGKNKNKKTNKKANKKLAKKERNKEIAAVTGSEVESEALAESGADDDSVPAKPHVEFSPPVVVEVAADEPPQLVKIRKRGKDPKVKPILINKEDPSCVSDPTSASTINVSNHFEEMQPKDEFELMQSSLVAEKVPEKKEEVVEKKEKSKHGKQKAAKTSPVETPKEEQRDRSVEAPMEQRKAKKTEKKAPVEVVEEVVPPLNPPQPSELTTDKLLKQAIPAQPAPPQPAKNKKKKHEQNVSSLIAAAGEGAAVGVSELVRAVRAAALSRTEVQILIDALLDRHHDPLPQHSDWTEGPNDPMQKLKKQLAEKEKALAEEVEASQALHAKLKELRTSLNAERARSAELVRASEQAATSGRAAMHTQQARLQRLLEDNRALAQEKIVLQAKLSEEAEAQAQRVQMEMHIQRLSEAEQTLLGQLGALQAELQARVVDTSLAQQHAADLAQQLQEAQRVCGELEQQRQCAAHADQLAQQELRAERDRRAELQNEVQRLTSLAQIAEAAMEKVEGLQKEKTELSKEVRAVREQLAGAESELAEMRAMRAAPAHNGLPNDDKAAELSKVESVVATLREELSAAQRSSAEQQAQLAQLREQLANHARKNDQVTKEQESKISEAVSVLSAACPTAAPPAAAAPAADWLHTFASNLKKELQKREEERKQLEAELSSTTPKTEVKKQLEDMQKTIREKESEKKQVEQEMRRKLQEKDEARVKLETELRKKIEESEKASKKVLCENSSTDNSRVTDLLAQNKHLQSLVDKYKRVIDDTEGVLSRLQANVSREEQRWQQLLADKQRELDLLQQTTVLQLQSKIDTLEAQLKQAQKPNHINNFTDSERIAQEKLMSVGLTEKLDVHNGPLAVGK
ncbi:ribosome-binding protein 1 isoform X2 [Aricia agestis]|uniref:ribosome-binding protein 1 isoform X2 n=1 Tax=Aricia agestis TaxID=91739 RepID=UPI001C20BDB1|nr:ribosome-binding protein 1 isoform X2 [Aricia agestis]